MTSTIITESVFAPAEFAAGLAVKTAGVAASGSGDRRFWILLVIALVIALLVAIAIASNEYLKNNPQAETQVAG